MKIVTANSTTTRPALLRVRTPLKAAAERDLDEELSYVSILP
jgi:hypothetical protein